MQFKHLKNETSSKVQKQNIRGITLFMKTAMYSLDLLWVSLVHRGVKYNEEYLDPGYLDSIIPHWTEVVDHILAASSVLVFHRALW